MNRKNPQCSSSAPCEREFRGLGWSCGGTEEEHRALAQLGTPCTSALPQSKQQGKRNLRSRTQTLLRAGRDSSLLLMLHSLSLNFSLFSSKSVLSHLFACLFCDGNTSPLDTLLSILCHLAWSCREEEAVCFAVGT